MDEVPTEVSDEESRAAMRGFLQRSEVRLSTIHRVGQALLGGSALILLLPLFLRDAFPKMTTLLISTYDAHQSWVVVVGIATASALCVLLPVIAIYLLVGDLLGFYFTSNIFGAPGAGHQTPSRTMFSPRFIVPGLGFNNDELNDRTRVLLEEGREDEWTRALLVPKSLDDARAGGARARQRQLRRGRHHPCRVRDAGGKRFPGVAGPLRHPDLRGVGHRRGGGPRR